MIMDFLQLKDISETTMELVNPTTPEKLLRAGRTLGLRPGQRVIDYGCGYGEMLALWAEAFGIGGVGIDIRPLACERARRKMDERGLAERIEIVCGRGAEYPAAEGAFDVAACVGASFIWDGFRPALGALRRAIRPAGRALIGEPYWLHGLAPPALAQREGFHAELELLHIARQEGFDFETVIRSSHDDWDRYESDNWVGLLRWIEANPDHPERGQVIAHLRESQDEYVGHGREHFGWALYVLKPAAA
jgi:SAM-dependent methyltransferase